MCGGIRDISSPEALPLVHRVGFDNSATVHGDGPGVFHGCCGRPSRQSKQRQTSHRLLAALDAPTKETYLFCNR